MTVLFAEISVHPKSLPLVSVHATDVVVLIVLNCCGNWIDISEFRVTGVGVTTAKLTGSYCLLMRKV